MSGASKEGNREKHFRLWKALEKEVERLEKGGRERAPIMSDLKKVVLKEIWGGREALLMGGSIATVMHARRRPKGR